MADDPEYFVREQRFVKTAPSDPGRWFAVIEGINPPPVSYPGDLITIDGKEYLVRSFSYDTMNGYRMDLQDVDSVIWETGERPVPVQFDPDPSPALDWWDQ